MHVFWRLLAWIFQALLWMLSAAIFISNAVGRTTFFDDWDAKASPMLKDSLIWLFSTPWWVPALLGTVLTGWLMWVTYPQGKFASAPVSEKEVEPRNSDNSNVATWPIEVGMELHDAPNQDDVPIHHTRFCVGCYIRSQSDGVLPGVSAVAKVSDPRGWVFEEKEIHKGSLNPQQLEIEYPIEVVASIEKNSLRYKKWDDSDYKELRGLDQLHIEVIVSAESVPETTTTIRIKRRIANSEFVVAEIVEED